MSNLKREINKAAHLLAQFSEAQIGYALAMKCRALRQEGKSQEDISEFLRQTVMEGQNGLNALLNYSAGHKERGG